MAWLTSRHLSVNCCENVGQADGTARRRVTFRSTHAHHLSTICSSGSGSSDDGDDEGRGGEGRRCYASCRRSSLPTTLVTMQRPDVGHDHHHAPRSRPTPSLRPLAVFITSCLRNLDFTRHRAVRGNSKLSRRVQAVYYHKAQKQQSKQVVRSTPYLTPRPILQSSYLNLLALSQYIAHL